MNTGICLLETVEGNKSFFTDRQIKEAKRARDLYHILGAPSVPSFKSMLRMNVIKNCPVTIKHVDVAAKIYGIDVSTLKGKSTRKRPPKVLSDTVDVPKELYNFRTDRNCQFVRTFYQMIIAYRQYQSKKK